MDYHRPADPTCPAWWQQANGPYAGGGERVMYILSTGCQWRTLPKDLPARSTVNDYLHRWNHDRTLDRIHHALYVLCREQAGRKATPSAAIIDSQSIKGAEKGGAALIPQALMRVERSGVASVTCWSTRKAC